VDPSGKIAEWATRSILKSNTHVKNWERDIKHYKIKISVSQCLVDDEIEYLKSKDEDEESSSRLVELNANVEFYRGKLARKEKELSAFKRAVLKQHEMAENIIPSGCGAADNPEQSATVQNLMRDVGVLDRWSNACNRHDVLFSTYGYQKAAADNYLYAVWTWESIKKLDMSIVKPALASIIERLGSYGAYKDAQDTATNQVWQLHEQFLNE
jgi:hypothetical protein